MHWFALRCAALPYVALLRCVGVSWSAWLEIHDVLCSRHLYLAQLRPPFYFVLLRVALFLCWDFFASLASISGGRFEPMLVWTARWAQA